MTELVALKRQPGERGRQKAPTKERVSKTRIDDALREYVVKHR